MSHAVFTRRIVKFPYDEYAAILKKCPGCTSILRAFVQTHRLYHAWFDRKIFENMGYVVTAEVDGTITLTSCLATCKISANVWADIDETHFKSFVCDP